MSDTPAEGLTVVGGPALSRVDTDAVRAASARLADAAAALGAASGSCLAAVGVLDRAVWSPAFGDVDAARVARLRWARTCASDAADALGAGSRRCTTLAERLLAAAGLYRHAETAVEQVLGGLATFAASYLSYGVTRWLTGPERLPWWAAAKVALGLLPPTAAPDAGTTPATAGGPASSAASGPTLTGGLLRAWAPLADEVVAGAAHGVSLGVPLLAREPTVTGGARVLSTVVDLALPEVSVEIEEVTDGGFTQGPPDWTDRPAETVEEAMARCGDLYPAGSGVPDRDLPGTPTGTVAVQKIVGADGEVSWLVLIPGTQDLLSASHPFDVDTDLDLMARKTADVMVGVVQALDAAGVGRDEPVVLVGHSLGGIAATSLAASPAFGQRYRLGGVVTAGAPTATFTTPPGVPVLHVENTEELVSPLDGRSSAENPATVDRVTVGRRLADSDRPADVVASGSVAVAHQLGTHLRTLAVSRDAGNVQVATVKGRIDAYLDGERAETRFYRIGRVPREEG